MAKSAKQAKQVKAPLANFDVERAPGQSERQGGIGKLEVGQGGALAFYDGDSELVALYAAGQWLTVKRGA